MSFSIHGGLTAAQLSEHNNQEVLEGVVGINVDHTLQDITTIAGAPGVAQTVYIGGNDGTTYGDNTGLKTLWIGGSVAANAIHIADNQLTGSVAIGTRMTTGTISIGGNGLQTGGISIGAGTGAQTLTLGGTGANTVVVANTQTAGSVSVGAAMTTGTINIGGTGAQTGTIDIAVGTGAQIVNVASGAGAKTLNIGTGAAPNVITLGTTNGAASLSLASGTGGISLPNYRTTITNQGGASPALTRADSGKIQCITDLVAITFSNTIGLAPVAGCVYEFLVMTATPGGATINVNTNIGATLIGGVVCCDADTTASTVPAMTAGGTIITFTTAAARNGSWVKLVFRTATEIGVTGMVFGNTPATPFS